MARIKSVKKAHTVQCKDAVTKEAVKAVLSGSRDAVYKHIDIHGVRLADVSEESGVEVCCIYDGFNTVSAKKATVDYINTDVSGCKKADSNLTIDDLFRNI